MRRFLCFLLVILSFGVFPALAAPAQTDSTEIYIQPEGLLPDTVTYHGENEQAAFTKGTANGKAMTFSGTEYLTADITEVSAPFTLTAWVNWQGNTTGERIFTLLKSNSENYISLSPWTDTAVVGGAAANGVTLLTSCFKEQFLRENYFYPAAAGVSDALKKDTWHHIAVTVEETAVCVYIDGVLWKAVNLPFSYTELGADTLYIGSAAEGNHGFKGGIQEFTLHTPAKDAVGIAQMYVGTTPEDTETVTQPGSYAAAVLPDAASLQQTRTVTLDANGGAVFSQNTAAFWEHPQIATGQTISGTLTLQNKSGVPVSLKLSDVALPAQDTPAYQYLSEIKITVMQDTTLLYDGAYTSLLASSLSFNWPQLPNEREFTYTVTLSRPFSATTPVADAAVVWKWETATFPINENPLKGIPQSGWLIILLCVSAVAVGFSFYWAVIRRPRRIFTFWDTVASTLRKENTADTEDTE